MNRPYIICHMMTSLDGRIDCSMTKKLRGTEEYYKILDDLNISVVLCGRVTAELEMADKEKYSAKNNEIIETESFSKKLNAKGYNVVTDTMGTLLWNNYSEERPLLIITSEQTKKEYFDYLNSKNISWIACGKEKINIKRAMEILKEEFNIHRLAVTGGGTINGGFLEEKLFDEINILIGPGIDGRKGMTSVFDGLSMEREPVQLELKNVKSFENGAVWIQYKVLN